MLKIFITLLFFTPFFLHAQIPLNTTFVSTTTFGDVTTQFYDSSAHDINYVYAISMQQERDLSDTRVYCGDKDLGLNYGKDYPQVFIMYDCGSESIYIQKTGNDEAFVSMIVLNEEPVFTFSGEIVQGGYLGPTMQEWLFVAMVFLFFVSLGMWGLIFKPFREIK